MQLIKSPLFEALPADEIQRFFVETWYNQVHLNSLDSHRVRCMNCRNILRELSELIGKSGQQNVAGDIRKVSSEFLRILDTDTVARACSKRIFDTVRKLVTPLVTLEKEPKNSEGLRKACFYINDALTLLKAEYKERTLTELEGQLFACKPCEQSKDIVLRLTGCLLSILLDEGYTLEGLYGLLTGFLLSQTDRSFSDRFNIVKSIITAEKTNFEIIFRLEGCKRGRIIPNAVGEIQFDKHPHLRKTISDSMPFLKPGEEVIFASINVEAPDDRSAGVIARSKLDEVLDLIRFELERNVIHVGQEFLSSRKDKDRPRIFRLPYQIPNPRRNPDSDRFKRFVSDLSEVLNRVDSRSAEKIASALRARRIGLDTERFENKLLSWWTGLEFLLIGYGGKGFGGGVESMLVPILILDYVPKHVRSLTTAIRYLNKDAIRNWKSAVEFLQYLRAEKDFQQLLEILPGRPALKYQITWFKDQTKDAKAIQGFLTRHEENLSWHIHRLWRTRCDIVHSSKHSLNLTLLCANLEFYLKSALGIVVGYLKANPSIKSLDELYTRIRFQYDCQKEALEDGDVSVFEELLESREI